MLNILSNLSPSYFILSGHVILISFIYWDDTSFQKEFQVAGERIWRKYYIQVVIPKHRRGFSKSVYISAHYSALDNI